MSATIIDGKAVAADIRRQVAEEAAAFAAATGRPPGLAVIRVGEDPASKIYVNNKRKAAAQVGVRSWEHALPEDTPRADLLALIERLNRDPEVHGILVQLPLPGHLDEAEIVAAVAPQKDVDGFHPLNVGRLWEGNPGLVPCTPAGIMELIRRTGVDPQGRRAVIIGRSNIVGKPAAALLLAAHATVTICHSRTRDLPAICREGDIVVAAVGRPRLVQAGWIKPGAVVIDVGINRLPGGGLAGDVDFDGVREVAGYITPVPGGVGPMTIAMLLANTLKAARMQSAARS
ncbi:MAG TPA: bifunctional methylenetetrahydrofolate dehydrogenase/methenyltetrahydrofolate cyclohydrolase FolD [Limnochordales bacterium]|nr:bifunctional methylenetetrahydrofolate dehydrogenase/methenyltetrahydrofolate cyclohydrolase FolD [Limnochordales bacterium]